MDRRKFLGSMAAATLAPSAASAAISAHEDTPRPADTSHTFPPEWEPHEAVWMGWDDYVSEMPDHEKLRLDMLAALTPHVPVTMIVADEATAQAIGAKALARGIDTKQIRYHLQPTTDVWTRDCGPLFVSDGRTNELAAFAWRNYGFPWPYTDPASLQRGELDQQVAERLGLRQRTSDVVAEGGGLEVNSRVLVTYRDAMMQRNPSKTLAEVEAELKRLYGKEMVIWLDRAPITDRVLNGPKIGNIFGWGANGHVDEYVRFVSEDTVLVGEVAPEERGKNALMRLEHEILTENRRQLEAARDPDGEPFNVVPMPVPDVWPFARTRTLTEADFEASESGFDQRLIYRDFNIGDEVIDIPAVSYLNFLVTNGVVLSAKYGGEGRPEHLARSDDYAANLLRSYFPDREVVQIDALAANWYGGGMHCLTQQQPLLSA
jgi:agmatine deiminase